MNVDDATFAGSEPLEFPGYEAERLTVQGAHPQVTGLKPVKVGPVEVKVSFKGYQVLVDVRVDPIAGFESKAFKTLKLYPEHLTDHDTINYGEIHVGSVYLKLTAAPAEQRLYVHVQGKVLGQEIETVNHHFPYGQFRFPDTSHLAHLTPVTPDQVQAVLDKATWRTAEKGTPHYRNDSQTQSDIQNVFTMLGGSTFIPDTRRYLSESKHGLTAGPTPLMDTLSAIGIVGEAGEGVVSGGIGGGFYFTDDDVGLYGSASASIGFALEASVEMEYAVYWGLAGPGSALENFSGLEYFVRVGGGYLGVASCTLCFDAPIKPIGVTMSIGGGVGFSAAVGTSATATYSFKKH